MDKHLYHIIKQHHNLDDREVDDRTFLNYYSKFSGWLIQYQLTTKTNYMNDLHAFANDAERSSKDGIADLSRSILADIEKGLPENRIYHIDDVTDNRANAKPVTWGELNNLIED